MIRDDIIRIAREAGIPIEIDWVGRPSTLVVKDGGTYLRGVDDLERFAALVAAAERERIIAANAPEIDKINAHIKALEDAVAAEREACAQLCERMARRTEDIRRAALEMAADAIRARK